MIAKRIKNFKNSSKFKLRKLPEAKNNYISFSRKRRRAELIAPSCP
jgi:hypothetical protein